MTTRYFGEDIPAESWGPIPSDGRLIVGGRTVWTSTPPEPVLVTQPNRWGLAEPGFPAVPCLVEIDPVIAGALARPEKVVGWVDRRHQPVAAPTETHSARRLIGRAARLAKMLDQLKGVRVIAVPTARTVAFTTPIEATGLIAGCVAGGIEGLRSLAGIGGAVAAVVSPDHTDEDFHRLADLVQATVL